MSIFIIGRIVTDIQNKFNIAKINYDDKYIDFVADLGEPDPQLYATNNHYLQQNFFTDFKSWEHKQWWNINEINTKTEINNDKQIKLILTFKF
jgi:hypothetical protein